MIPGQRYPEGDQTPSDLDQTSGVGDQTLADRDEAGSCDSGREAPEARRQTSSERHATAAARDATAHERDLSALVRDRAAHARDLEAESCDAEIAALASSYGTRRATTGASIILRAARDRERAAADRVRSAGHRVRAGVDREQSARDRLLSADDRALAAGDRARATAEREADEIDTVTGARRRAPGLAELQRTIDRARRGNGQLIVAYVDVNDLKTTNDSKGHHAGDVMLRHIVEVLQANLRSYDSVTRLGGDEFVCTISDATMENVGQRFDEIGVELTNTPEEGSITVGLAEFERGDSPMDLIDRADRGLLASRSTQDRKRRSGT